MGVSGDKMRKVLFSLILLSFILVFLPGIAGAFEDSIERYPNGTYTDYWTWSSTSPNNGANLAYNSEYATNTFKMECVGYYSSYGTTTLRTKGYIIDPSYASITIRSLGITDSLTAYIDFLNKDTGATIATASLGKPTANTKYECVWGSDLKVYKNGTLIQTVSTAKQSNVLLQIRGYGLYGGSYYQIDDITTSSIIGIPEVITESSDNLQFTYSGQLMRSYSEHYIISLYSLSNPSNSGFIKSWDIGNTPEFGKVNDSRINVLGSNFGLYMLEISRGSDILYDQYFYYDQLANPQGFPEILLQGTSNVNADIRDEDSNGGEVEAGESVYLYPDVNTNGIYNITFNILELPYSIETEVRKVYSTVAFNQTNIHYSGLTGQNYNVFLDGSQIGSTLGADTFDYNITWGSETSHIISFSPDYSLPGIWGYVKNSVTQTPIKSASVVISNAAGTQYLYTDSNGMYYKTQGIEAGYYNVSASKTGYTASNPFLILTQNGSTTRKDIFLDKTSGEGTYYNTHDVTFTVLEYWYSHIGVPGVEYTVTDEAGEVTAAGYTDTKGRFAIEDMNEATNYTFDLRYNGTNHTEYIIPSLLEYTIVLNKEAEIIHQYYNNWLTLNYTESNRSIAISYVSNKSIAGATAILKYSNGSIASSQNLNTQTGTFNFNSLPAANDYIINFNITASDNEKASQSWVLSAIQKVPLFPDSYPSWLKNTLFVAIILVFMLAFGKSKNDIACLAAAVLTSLGEFFGWLECSYYFVVLVWIIALGAVYLHYKRTGALG